MPLLATDLFNEALGDIAPWKVTKVLSMSETGDYGFHLILNIPPLTTLKCPTCGRSCSCYDHSKERVWRSTDVASIPLFLHARVPRVKCDGCGKTQSIGVPWARPGSRYTLMFETMVLALAMEEPLSTVASQLRVNYRMVAKVVRNYCKDLVENIDLSTVTRVGVDERSVFKGHTYISIFVNLDTRKLLFATPGKDAECLGKFAKFLKEHGSHPRRITEFSSDFGAAFISGIKKYFPKCKLVGDRFHLMKMANEALADVRFSTRGMEICHQKAKYLLATNSDSLSDQQKTWVKGILEANPALATAYRLRDSLADTYCMGNRETAKQHLETWIKATEFSKLKPFKRLSGTIARHKEMILNWYLKSSTNASLEGTNNLLNKVKARCYGFHKVETFVDMAYLVASKARIDIYGKPRCS